MFILVSLFSLLYDSFTLPALWSYIYWFIAFNTIQYMRLGITTSPGVNKVVEFSLHRWIGKYTLPPCHILSHFRSHLLQIDPARLWHYEPYSCATFITNRRSHHGKRLCAITKIVNYTSIYVCATDRGTHDLQNNESVAVIITIAVGSVWNHCSHNQLYDHGPYADMPTCTYHHRDEKKYCPPTDSGRERERTG